MLAYQKNLLAPTGCSHAISVRLTPAEDGTAGSSSTALQRGTLISHLITARDSLIQVWEVREFEGTGTQKPTAKLQHILSRRLHGTVTALARVRTLASKVDGADRVLISFLDAKMSLMEWTPSAHDLLPVSLHTFEKLPQVAEGLAKSVTDPGSRLSVLLLPSNTGGDATLAILPFFQEELDLEGVDEVWGSNGMASLPYAPSHLLPLASLTSSHSTFASAVSRSITLSNLNSTGPPPVRNIIDLVFLPGFNEPTLALLYAPEQTWPGRTESISNNCLVSLVTLAANTSTTNQAGATSAILIATSPALPHSCLAVHPCPPDLGGVLIVTANGVLHLEQGGKVIGSPSNGWFGKEWLGAGGGAAALKAKTVKEPLEGSKVVFIANDKAIFFCRSGTILELTLRTAGRSVSRMTFKVVGQTIAGSCTERIRGSVGRFGEEGYVFVGSEVGESSLLRWEIGGTRAAAIESEANKALLQGDDGMDVDDEEIYGASVKTQAQAFTSVGVPGQLTLSPSDIVDAYGGMRDMTVGLVGDDCPAEIVACTGGGPTAGFNIFHRTIPPHKRRRLDVEGTSTRGVWSIALRTESSAGSVNLLITSDTTSTQISSQANGVTRPNFHADTATVSAASLFHSTIALRVTPSELILHDSDLNIIQSISLSNSSIVERAIVSDPYVLVLKADCSVELFASDESTRSLISITLPSHYLESLTFAALFADTANFIPLLRPKPPLSPASRRAQLAAEIDAEDDDLYATAPKRKTVALASHHAAVVVSPSLETGATSHGGIVAWNWLPVLANDGSLEILSLPTLEVIFSSCSVNLFPDVIEDGASAVPLPAGSDVDDIEIDQVVCLNVGESRPRPHLLILLKNGSLAVYEAFAAVSATISTTRSSTLGVRFVKVLTRRLPAATRQRVKGAATDALPPARREFIPFQGMKGFSGAFVTGEDPLWLLASDHGPARIFDHSEKKVYGFSKLMAEGEEADYIFQSRIEMATAFFPAESCFDRELPYTRKPRDRRYNSFTFDIDTGLYVAGALFDTVFMNFDDDGQPVFVNDSSEFIEPRNYRSALELIVPGTWTAIHGYEFRPNEFISTIKSTNLHSRSTASGKKEFIAVGTTVYRAEDLAARGGIYIFEVIKIVPDPSTPEYDHQLKLLFFEDTKSVVANVCAIEGYLVMSMGQKLYVRAFEQDEVLLAVAFIDVGVHVTSLQAIKNFLLIGDALKSVTLIAFQEDPYKLVVLGRDYRPNRASSANYLVNDGRMAFIVSDMNGVIRLYEYDPSDIASFQGQKLLCRTEYKAGNEAGASMLYAKRSRNEKEELKQSGILYGGIDGSLSIVAPVREIVFKRLQSLQAALTRHVQHFGGLNPRGYRMVKNDLFSRAITKGILDGELLSEFEKLSYDRQIELTNLIGTDPDTVLLNLRDLGTW